MTDAPEFRRRCRNLHRPRPAALLAAVVATAGISLGACGGGSSGSSETGGIRADGIRDNLSPAGAPPAIRVETGAPASAVDEWYLNVADGCRLYVREFGVGDTVVVVHGGFGAEHSYLLDAVAGLEQDHHLVFYDQRGSLRSPCPDSTISVARHVQDLERLRQEMGLERMDVLAHSMGTFVAMSHLQQHPDAVGTMTLLGPIVPRAPTTEEERSLYQSQQEEFVQWARAREKEELEEEGLARPDSLLSDREQTHKWRIGYASGNVYRIDRWRLVKGGRAFYDASAGRAAGQTMGEWDFTEVLDAHPHPVTMVLGDHDLVGFGGELHRRMVEPLEGTSLILVSEAGHNAWIDRPERIRSILQDALTEGRGTP